MSAPPDASSGRPPSRTLWGTNLTWGELARLLALLCGPPWALTVGLILLGLMPSPHSTVGWLAVILAGPALWGPFISAVADGRTLLGRPRPPDAPRRSLWAEIRVEDRSVHQEITGGTVHAPTVYGDYHYHEASAEISVDPLHTLRAPVADFTGRTREIEELTAHLMGDGAAALISGIHGMGGVGKTELALVVAHRLLDRYPDAQLLLDLQPGGEPRSPEDLLAEIIRAFLPRAQLPTTLAELQAMYRAVLYGHRGLLLLDNAADGCGRCYRPRPGGPSWSPPAIASPCRAATCATWTCSPRTRRWTCCVPS